MRKLLGAIFGSSEHTGTVLAGIDKTFFTNEEKSDFFLQYLAATQPQNLARRMIAVIVVILWAFLILAGVAVYKLDAGYSMFIFDTLRDVVNAPFSIIIGFYFAAHVVRAWTQKK